VDELVAVCPITGQPDLYVVSIEYTPKDLCLESKVAEAVPEQLPQRGVFCEALAVRIRDDVAEAPQAEPRATVRVELNTENPAAGHHDHCSGVAARADGEGNSGRPRRFAPLARLSTTDTPPDGSVSFAYVALSASTGTGGGS